jgi:hypothetical protein
MHVKDLGLGPGSPRAAAAKPRGASRPRSAHGTGEAAGQASASPFPSLGLRALTWPLRSCTPRSGRSRCSCRSRRSCSGLGWRSRSRTTSSRTGSRSDWAGSWLSPGIAARVAALSPERRRASRGITGAGPLFSRRNDPHPATHRPAPPSSNGRQLRARCYAGGAPDGWPQEQSRQPCFAQVPHDRATCFRNAARARKMRTPALFAEMPVSCA